MSHFGLIDVRMSASKKVQSLVILTIKSSETVVFYRKYFFTDNTGH